MSGILLAETGHQYIKHQDAVWKFIAVSLLTVTLMITFSSAIKRNLLSLSQIMYAEAIRA